MPSKAAGPVLKSQRLTLRPPGPADAPRMASLANDPGIARMTASMPFPFAETDAEAFIDRVQGVDPAHEPVFALEAEHGLIGVLGFHPKEGAAPEVGYWLGRPYWGRGYATEAVRAAMAWVGSDWGKRVIVAGHFADNPESGAVLCKAGFLYTGEVLLKPSKARGEKAPTRMMVWLP